MLFLYNSISCLPVKLVYCATFRKANENMGYVSHKISLPHHYRKSALDYYSACSLDYVCNWPKFTLLPRKLSLNVSMIAWCMWQPLNPKFQTGDYWKLSFSTYHPSLTNQKTVKKISLLESKIHFSSNVYI